MSTNKKEENNQVTIEGEISGEFVFSHEIFGERFYMIDISTRRLSGVCDAIPVTVSERLIDVTQNYIGQYVCVRGQFRSYNQNDGSKVRLILSVFAQEIEFAEKLMEDVNQIYLDGYICKEPVYRKTPLGREIADLLIAVNRSYGKSDYIPCICWGRNARFVSGLEIGSHIRIKGMVQSRQYIKKLDNDRTEERVAYEVSISRLDVVENEE